jgi:hypothetical protein
MVYLARKNGAVIYHTDLAAMKRLDGISSAEKTITDTEWNESGGLARIIDNEIFIGKTESEKAAEKAEAERTATVADLKKKLADTDYIACKIAEGSASKTDYAAVIAQRQQWRAKVEELEAQAAPEAA